MGLLAEAAPVYAADPYPTLAGGQSLDTRLYDVTETLKSQQTDAQYWEYGWGAFDAGTMVWSLVQAGQESDSHYRKTDYVNAGESLIGLADVIFRPLPAFNPDAGCKEHIVTEQDEMQCLAAREALLERSAERAQEPYEALPHLANFGFNLFAGLLVWRLDNTTHALETAIPGEIIGELQLWSTPSGPIGDYEKYRIRFSPMITQSDRTHAPATGVMLSMRF